MKKKKEQLNEEVVKKPAEEPKKEEPATSSEEPSEEEKIKEVKELDEETEQLFLEIEDTREELAVIKEVRDELVKLYAENQKYKEQTKNYNAENAGLKSSIETLTANLHDYKVAEEKLQAEKQLQRLEQLSAKFSALGQTKTVEQLGAKDSETLAEFEKIVDAALDKVGQTTEMPSVTSNSNAECLSDAPSEEEKPSEEVAKEKPKEEQLNKGEKFFENLCTRLSNEQVGSNRKRGTLF